MSKAMQGSSQSRTAPGTGSGAGTAVAKKPSLPAAIPVPAQSLPLIASVRNFLRIGPPRAPRLKSANPGLDLMAEVEQIRKDIAAHLPGDPYLKRLLVRHDAQLREGEGHDAAREASDIDAYVAEQIVRYARLRRRESAKKGFRVISSAAFVCVEYQADRKAIAVVNFSITGAGHAARGSIRITI